MLKAKEVSEYFLSKDPERVLFNKNLITRGGRTFYEGNVRLNKYLHLSQNVYIAKTGAKLFEDDLYAYDNGAVAVKVQENYAILWARNTVPALEDDIADFLDKIYRILENAPLDELIEISHEDSEWMLKHTGYAKDKQKMDSLAHAAEYREQYADVLEMMERMKV